jgi:hypothetical protein
MRVEHGAEDVEKLLVTGFSRDSRPVGIILFVPVDVPHSKTAISGHSFASDANSLLIIVRM